MSSTHPKKLIEVALPLPEINDASSYDKMPGIGPHPKGIHHWWARLPLPCARAVLFASVVTDPSDDPTWRDKSEAKQDARREELFDIIRRLMGKKLHEHPEVYEEAHREMLRHCDGKLPTLLDPFAGGGSIPLEAARLGFPAYAADLNPVAVLLNKCNLELAPRWAGQPPANPDDRKKIGGAQAWAGTHGLAADVRYYGRLIRTRAQEKIGHLYPTIRLPKEHGGGEANVIAWLWARTVASQDPAAKGAHVPLITSYWLANNGAKSAWLEPVIDRAAGTYRFDVKTGTPSDKAAVRAGTKLGRRAFRCLLSGEPLEYNYLRAQAKEQKLGYVLTSIVAETKRGRVYLPADAEHERLGRTNEAKWKPEEFVTTPCHDVDRLPMYGMPTWGDAFTPRQLTALTTLVELVKAVRTDIEADAQRAALTDGDADAYVKTVCTFLALAVDRTADFNAAVCSWNTSNQKVMHVFGRQAIPMNWDFGEANTLGDSVGAWSTCCDYVADCVEVLTAGKAHRGEAAQVDAANGASGVDSLIVSTDPPYYDNIGYAALSDFFYVWLRRSVGDLYPDIFSTMLVPKTRELTASPERFDGDKEKAKVHFESGFRHAFSKLRDRLDSRFPLTVYYAFKQEDAEDSGADDERKSSAVDLTTGWETLLEALIWTEQAEPGKDSEGFTITATWPVRASQMWRMVAMGTSSLASYIVLACRPRAVDAPRVGRNTFVAELKRELPPALHHLQQGSVAPVDFAQAAIGPGMAIFSRYAAVLESNGKPMSVRTALALINGMKDELLGESVEELDKDTRWAVTWFDEDGFGWGEAGKANLLANAHATALNGLVAADIVEVKGNQVRLLRPEDLPADWDPRDDTRLTVWGMTHHLLRVYYHEKEGDEACAVLLRKLGSKADVARDLAYKLFSISEKKGRSAEAQAYNALVLGWPELARLAQSLPLEETVRQAQLL
jgi:putative DNA methylase